MQDSCRLCCSLPRGPSEPKALKEHTLDSLYVGLSGLTKIQGSSPVVGSEAFLGLGICLSRPFLNLQ